MRKIHPQTTEQMQTQHIHRISRMNHSLSQIAHWALIVLGIGMVLVSSEQTRHWLAESVATVCVVGGFIAAPILTILAWVGMMLPNLFPLHRISTLLFIIAIVWLALAFFGAHLHHAHQQARNTHK
jgi:hypothetical protein